MRPSVTIIALLLAGADTALGSLTCGIKATSCSNLPTASSKACSSLISKSRLQIATCSLPSQTVTKVTTVTAPVVKKTVTVTSTLTNSLIRTTTSTTIKVDASTSTERATTTTTATLLNTVTTTTSGVTTVTSPYQEQASICTTAAIIPRDYGYGSNNQSPLPKDCSCYLTSITTCGTTTVYSTTSKAAATATATVTTFVTVTKVSTLQTVRVATTSITTTAHVTNTVTTTTKMGSTTVTESIIATETAIAGFCDNINRLALTGRPSFGGVEVFLAGSGDANGDPLNCCNRCRNTCVYFVYIPHLDRCDTYISEIPTSCTTPQCRFGVKSWSATTEKDGDQQYFRGRCINPLPSS